MTASKRNLGLGAAQALLWFFAAGALLSLVNTPLGMARGRYWLNVGLVVTTGVLSALAAVLIRRRDRRGIVLVVGTALLAVFPVIVFQGVVPTVRVAIWALLSGLVLLNKRDFDAGVPAA